MFRMWFMTFAGQPRDQHAYDHAHESPPVMYLPLVVLAVLAISVAWNYQYIGYFAIAAAFFVGRAWQQGWFKHLLPPSRTARATKTSSTRRPSIIRPGCRRKPDTSFPAHPPDEHTHVLHSDPGVPGRAAADLGLGRRDAACDGDRRLARSSCALWCDSLVTRGCRCKRCWNKRGRWGRWPMRAARGPNGPGRTSILLTKRAIRHDRCSSDAAGDGFVGGRHFAGRGVLLVADA